MDNKSLITHKTTKDGFALIGLAFFLFYVFFSGTRYPVQVTYIIGIMALAWSLYSVRFRVRVDSCRIMWLLYIIFIWVWTKNYSANVLLYNIPVTLLLLFLIVYSHSINSVKLLRVFYSFCLIAITITYIELIFGTRVNRIFEVILAPSYANIELQNIANGNSFRAFASGNNVLSFSCFVVICYKLYVKQDIRNNNGSNRNKYIILIMAIAAALLQSQRTNLIFAPMSIGLVYLVSDSKGRHNRFLRLFLILLGLIGAILIALPLLSRIPAFTRIVYTVEIFMNGGDIRNNRAYLYDTALNMWKEAPLFGHGWFEYFYTNHGIIQADTNSHAHNMLLELLADCGIIGTLIITTPVFYTYVQNILLLRKTQNELHHTDDMLRFTLAYQTFFLLDAQLHVTFYHPNMIILYLIVIILFYSLREDYRNNE